MQASVREREPEREKLLFSLTANGFPVQPPVQVASFVTVVVTTVEAQLLTTFSKLNHKILLL